VVLNKNNTSAIGISVFSVDVITRYCYHCIKGFYLTEFEIVRI
jgi:hypothetical protein